MHHLRLMYQCIISNSEHEQSHHAVFSTSSTHPSQNNPQHAQHNTFSSSSSSSNTQRGRSSSSVLRQAERELATQAEAQAMEHRRLLESHNNSLHILRSEKLQLENEVERLTQSYVNKYIYIYIYI